ncbi:MAG: GNAT family N-acetyltransferase [Theionarchaea archaeon]|nr:GNAT family N-acetyltransferase [Theionarchaea archaeon]
MHHVVKYEDENMNGTGESRNLSIEPATHEHVCDILEIWKELMDFHKALDPLFSRSSSGHIHMGTYIHDLIDQEDTQVYVAIQEGTVVGYAISQIRQRPPVFEESTYGIISDLAVTASCRRKGIGGALVDAMFEWFRRQGVERIELQVASRNEVAYSFWKKHGFADFKHILYTIKST